MLETQRSISTKGRGLDLPYLLAEWKDMFVGKTVLADVWAGLTVALVALPLNLALAVAAGVEPGVGLTTGIVAGIIGGVFGGQRYAITGPAAAMAVVLIEIAQTYGIGAIWLCGLLAGLMQVIAGVLKLGRLISFIPLPVIVGFTNAIGILVIFNSLDDFLGLPTKQIAHTGHTAPLAGHPLVPEFVQDVSHLFHRLLVHQEANLSAAAIGLLVFALAILVPKITKLVPGQLVAIVVASVIATALGLEIPRIIDLGHLASGLSTPRMPNLPWEQIDVLFGTAVTIFLLGSIESLLSASVADGMTMSRRHHSNQELIGQGLANIAVPFFGGIPVTGVIARTAVNIRAGAKTRLSSIIHSLALLILVLLMSKHAEQIPLSALGGVLVLTGFRLIEWDAFKQIWRTSKLEGYVVLLTTIASVLIDLTAGVLIGLILTCGLFIRQMAQLRIVPQEYTNDRRSKVRQPIPTCKFVGTFLVDGPLFFGATERFAETILLTQNLKVVVLHMKAVHLIDLTAVESIRSINAQLQRNGVRLVIAELPRLAFDTLRRSGLAQEIGITNFYPNYREALLSVNQTLLESDCSSCKSCLTPGDQKGPKDCPLRSGILLNTDQIGNLMRERIGRQQIASGYAAEAGEAVDTFGGRLRAVLSESDIPESLTDSPIGDILRSQNFYQVETTISGRAELIVGMCIDYRKQLHLTKNCAYVIRAAGANMRDNEFAIGLAVSTGIRYMALIVHDQCLMSDPFAKKEQFVSALSCDHGWLVENAVGFFDDYAGSHKIDDAIEFALNESARLSELFANLKVVPLMYKVDDDKLYLVGDFR